MELDFRKDPHILADIVDVMSIGVFTVDANARFAAWSNGAEQITGFSSADVIGKPCSILEGPNCAGFARLAELLRSPSPPTDGTCDPHCKLLSKDRRELHIHGSVRLLQNDQGQIEGAVGTFTDITSFVAATQKIAALEKQASSEHVYENMIAKSHAMKPRSTARSIAVSFSLVRRVEALRGKR